MLSWIKSYFTKPAPSKWSSYEWQWHDNLKMMLDSKVDTLGAASDILDIRPDFKILTHDEKVEVFCEFFKWLAYFESSWNPKSKSVDVGSKFDMNTWSVGLLQVSVCDQKNLNLYLDYDYDSLLMPLPNLSLGLAIMCNQVRKRGKIIIPKGQKGNPSLYWATLSPGNPNDRSDQIIKKVKSLRF